MRTSLLLAFFVVAAPAAAATYVCPATAKYEADREYSAEALERFSYSTKLEELPEGAFLSRCSYSPSAKKVTCDRYRVDRVEFDRNIGAKKFYVFSAQFDFQLFRDLSSVENNGRGGIQYGQCRLVAP